MTDQCCSMQDLTYVSIIKLCWASAIQIWSNRVAMHCSSFAFVGMQDKTSYYFLAFIENYNAVVLPSRTDYIWASLHWNISLKNNFYKQKLLFLSLLWDLDKIQKPVQQGSFEMWPTFATKWLNTSGTRVAYLVENQKLGIYEQ